MIEYINDWESLKNLFKTKKDTIQYLKKYEGLDNFLGSNTNGKVFKIKGQDKVLKVTKDYDEIENAIKLKGKNFKHVIEIYDVHKIEGYRSLAIIEAEYLYELNFSIGNYSMIQAYFISEDEDYLENFSSNVKKQIIDAYYEISSTLDASQVDINRGNIMQDKLGNIKFIDL